MKRVSPYLQEVCESAFALRDIQQVLHHCMVWLVAAAEYKDWCATMPDFGSDCFDNVFFSTCEDANVRLLSGLYEQVEKTHKAMCGVNGMTEHAQYAEDEEEEGADAATLAGTTEEMNYSEVLYAVGAQVLDIISWLEEACSNIMIAAGKVPTGCGDGKAAFTTFHIERYGDANVVLLCHLLKRTEACFTVIGTRNELDWGGDMEPGDEAWE